MQGTTVSSARVGSFLLAAQVLLAAVAILNGTTANAADAPAKTIDFNRDIRPILSNHCFQCHGPDARKRKGVSKPLRLDTEAGAFIDLGGYKAIVRGKPDESELVERITTDDPNSVMPPANTGKKLTAKEIERLTDWVRQGAPYARHWSYVEPVRPLVPQVRDKPWCKNAIDDFILARLEQEGLKPSPEADRHALIRRLSLDLTGLPPTSEETELFVHDKRPDAYEKLVDRLLDKPAYGEHWGRMWLDLARYADSAGYADDPARTIWGYRDYVIRAFNANKPFDQFTIEQIAGDLLANPTEEQLVATAFHRNTLTNNEGGTNDEEFRNVAVVDRVNTTLAVWMGTTIACAQCHDHKYDPFSQAEYFKLFAFLNNTEDADRTDESPVISFYSIEQKDQRAGWDREVATLEKTLSTSTPALLASQASWEKQFGGDPSWTSLKPSASSAKSGGKMTIRDDQSIVAESKDKTDVYTVKLPLSGARLSALRLEALADDALPGHGPGNAGGNFVISRVHATITGPDDKRPAGRFVHVEIPGKKKILSLAEVQVFKGDNNLARKGEAKQSSTAYDGTAARAIDGNTDGRYEEAKSTTHTDTSDNPWWEVDLKGTHAVDKIAIWNRVDNNVGVRLSDFRVTLLDEKRNAVWTQTVAKPPEPSTSLAIDNIRSVPFSFAIADYAQPAFEAASVLDTKVDPNRGWAVGGALGKSHTLTLVPTAPVVVDSGSVLTVTIEQLSKHERHTLGRFRLAATDDERAGEAVQTPASVIATLKTPAERRTEAQRAELTRHYLAQVAPELKAPRERLAALKAQLAAMKPGVSVPIFRELPPASRRTTRIQLRGNFLDQADQVSEGVPASLHTLPAGAPLNRLTLARWLVDEHNPLTARVIANRFWEQLFGTGIVATSEEFGAQGDLPTHPDLLDWLATELVQKRWDLKQFLKLLVMSSAYRQSSRVTPELFQRDPDNRLLARGPRVRLDAEMVRDQALAVSGLLSPKMYGAPVKPPQPSMGLSAAFGSGIDWQTSSGDDRYRRALYTNWRRSNPYPSMTTFDAPNREVCTVRRGRTNTPLQALVTLNDPVYVEAAQAIARQIASGGGTVKDKASRGFKVCVSRPPSDTELGRLVRLYESAYARYSKDAPKARQMATDPIGPPPNGADVAELAAWTVVGNVLLNLDEMLMKR